MNTRSDLVRLAQAGEPAAIQSFIEQNHGAIYRMALSMLNDPAEAARAARDSEAALIENLANYPGPGAHTAWVYRITLHVCRRRLRWQKLVRRLPPALSARLLPPPPPAPPKGWMAAAARLEDDLRVPLVLRYMHDLLPAEIAEVLGWRDGTVQGRLQQARVRLHGEHPGDDPISLVEVGPEEGLSHAQAEKLIEAAADFHITDVDAALLNRHLKQCPRCQEAARRLRAFEDEVRGAFHQRWDAEPVPAVGVATGVMDHRRRQTIRKHSFNLAGALLMTVLVVGLIVTLPNLLPDRVLPHPPAAPRLAAPAPAPTQTALPQLSPVPSSTAQPSRRGFPGGPTSEAGAPRIFSRRDLLNQIYPGKIAFSAFGDSTDHIFTYAAGDRTPQQLSDGVSENTFPVWSPNGRMLAYLSMPQSWGQSQIMVVNADGADRRGVTPANFPSAAPIKPDPTEIVKFPVFGPPHWSADSKSIVSAVWASRSSYFVAVFPIDGGKEIILPVDGLDRDFIDWSPDGTTIAYLGKSGRELWFWEPEQPLSAGKNPRIIYSDGNWEMVFGLAWAPDSYTIAVLSGMREQDVVQADLRIMRRYGVEVQDITLSIGTLKHDPQRSSHLAWSPDGRYLAFAAIFTDSDLASGRLMLVRAETRAMLSPLVVMDRGITGLAWSPDGRWLAFSAQYEIWVASLEAYENNQAALVRLGRLTGTGLSWQPVDHIKTQ